MQPPLSRFQHFLGLELSGAKNPKTTVALLEFYPQGKKVFLLDLFDRISPNTAVSETHGAPTPSTDCPNQTRDEALLETVQALIEPSSWLGVNVPLTLPSCICCQKDPCPTARHCPIPSVEWSRTFLEQQAPHKAFTPYTQRPIELWVRHQVLPQLPKTHTFDVDETLGGNRAPLTARMHYLRRHLPALQVVEVWPKLVTSILALNLGLHKGIVGNYRDLENGAKYREEFILALSKQRELFIYDMDLKKLSLHLGAFDAFMCAYGALLSATGQTVAPARTFPLESGWVHYPKLDAATQPTLSELKSGLDPDPFSSILS